jgi:hypothetical protein
VRRPGNLIHYLDNTIASHEKIVHIDKLWEVVMIGFSGVWPATRTKWEGLALGDVWSCEALLDISRQNSKSETISSENVNSASLVAFHKLSQWLTYSLIEPLSLAGIKFSGTEKLTGLAEYR